MKIVLVGYMGSGKSTVGMSLAKQLGYSFVDLDRYIETELNMSISDIFATKGEVFFRKKEAELLNALLLKTDSLVLATGGGTPCYGTVMKTLLVAVNTQIVYLKNSVSVLSNRLFKEKNKRPLIAHLKEQEQLDDFIKKHLFERSFYYNKAHKTIVCDRVYPFKIAEEIIKCLF